MSLICNVEGVRACHERTYGPVEIKTVKHINSPMAYIIFFIPTAQIGINHDDRKSIG